MRTWLGGVGSYSEVVKTRPKPRSILHVDLDPFVVSVERSLDPSLRGLPVIIGPAGGLVAAASAEAQAAGVRPGMPLEKARCLCPAAAFRDGDLEAYARVGEQVASVLSSVSRRVERLSADEATLDLTPDGAQSRPPAVVAEGLKDRLQQQLGLDASFGLAGSRLAARAASRFAKPRGLLIVLPGYDPVFLASQPLDLLQEVPPHLRKVLVEAGVTTLGHLLAHDESSLSAIVGPQVAPKLLAVARGEADEPIAVSAPPAWVHEDATIRDPRSDAAILIEVAADLASRCCRRLRPHDLQVASIAVEIEGRETTRRRQQEIAPPTSDEMVARRIVSGMAAALLEPGGPTRRIEVRFSRLSQRDTQTPLFPEAAGG